MKAEIIDSKSLDYIKMELNREIKDLHLKSSQLQKEHSLLMDRLKPDDYEIKKIVNLDCECQIETQCKRAFLNLLESQTKEIEI